MEILAEYHTAYMSKDSIGTLLLLQSLAMVALANRMMRIFEQSDPGVGDSNILNSIYKLNYP